LQDHSVQWESVPYCKIPATKAAKYKLRNGDIVFARTGATTGKSFLIKSCPEAVFASYLIRVRISPNILPEFVAYFFQSQTYWNQISENISGSAQPNCNASKLKTLNLPIAPLNEQRRIVAKLEKLLDKVDSCQKRLAKIPILLKRFRQTVLAAACSGELTADWRELNPCSEFERQDQLSIDHELTSRSLLDEPCFAGPPHWAVKDLRWLLTTLDQGWSPKCSIEPSRSAAVWGVIKTTAVQPLEFIEDTVCRRPDGPAPD
jgi:type I restriction enzyme S subunit